MPREPLGQCRILPGSRNKGLEIGVRDVQQARDLATVQQSAFNSVAHSASVKAYSGV